MTLSPSEEGTPRWLPTVPARRIVLCTVPVCTITLQVCHLTQDMLSRSLDTASANGVTDFCVRVWTHALAQLLNPKGKMEMDAKKAETFLCPT